MRDLEEQEHVKAQALVMDTGRMNRKAESGL